MSEEEEQQFDMPVDEFERVKKTNPHIRYVVVRSYRRGVFGKTYVRGHFRKAKSWF
jgi:hypothetical protein